MDRYLLGTFGKEFRMSDGIVEIRVYPHLLHSSKYAHSLLGRSHCCNRQMEGREIWLKYRTKSDLLE